eukprot:556560_1
MAYLIRRTHSSSIGQFNTTITSTTIVNHEIPVFLYYPLDEQNDVQYPVIVFAHGLRADALWYSWLYKDIVPLGYIVAYINSYTGFTMNQTQYAIDQRYTLKWLNTIVNNNISSPMYKKINTNKSMAAGHSEGGGASIISNGNEIINNLFHNQNKFSSIFVMAPCGIQGAIINSIHNIDIPTFVFTATMDCICPPQEIKYLYDELRATNCTFFADVSNGTHCHWMNAPEIQEIACSQVETDICVVNHPHIKNITVITEQKQLSIANKYIQLFINATLTTNNSNTRSNFQNIVQQLYIDQSNSEMAQVNISNYSCD